MPIDLDQIKNLDVQDKISRFREEFLIHDSSLIYLDGNSLGRLPKQTIIDINNYMINEWGEQLVNGPVRLKSLGPKMVTISFFKIEAKCAGPQSAEINKFDF